MKPFFARFLENQCSDEQGRNIRGGGRGNGTTNKHRDEIVTMKYPSDNDESGTL